MQLQNVGQCAILQRHPLARGQVGLEAPSRVLGFLGRRRLVVHLRVLDVYFLQVIFSI